MVTLEVIGRTAELADHMPPTKVLHLKIGERGGIGRNVSLRETRTTVDSRSCSHSRTLRSTIGGRHKVRTVGIQIDQYQAGNIIDRFGQFDADA